MRAFGSADASDAAPSGAGQLATDEDHVEEIERADGRLDTRKPSILATLILLMHSLDWLKQLIRHAIAPDDWAGSDEPSTKFKMHGHVAMQMVEREFKRTFDEVSAAVKPTVKGLAGGFTLLMNQQNAISEDGMQHVEDKYWDELAIMREELKNVKLTNERLKKEREDDHCEAKAELGRLAASVTADVKADVDRRMDSKISEMKQNVKDRFAELQRWKNNQKVNWLAQRVKLSHWSRT